MKLEAQIQCALSGMSGRTPHGGAPLTPPLTATGHAVSSNCPRRKGKAAAALVKRTARPCESAAQARLTGWGTRRARDRAPWGGRGPPCPPSRRPGPRRHTSTPACEGWHRQIYCRSTATHRKSRKGQTASAHRVLEVRPQFSTLAIAAAGPPASFPARPKEAAKLPSRSPKPPYPTPMEIATAL